MSTCSVAVVASSPTRSGRISIAQIVANELFGESCLFNQHVDLSRKKV